MSKRLLMLMGLLLSLALVAAACGSDDDDSSSDDGDAAAEEEAPAEEAPAEGGTVFVVTAETTITDFCDFYAESLEVPEDFFVGQVTDLGTVSDRTFNQSVWEAIDALGECLGFQRDFIETASEADYAPNIATMVEAGPDIIVTSGALIGTATAEAAAANPDIEFVGIDQFQVEYPDNYAGALFREDQAGYLAGTMAGLISESKIVCVVGGREDVAPVVRLVNSYVAGAQAIDGTIEGLTVYNESFTDEAKGASDADQFMGEGCDVVFGAGGLTGSAGMRAGAEAGAWAIGVDKDEYFGTFSDGNAPGAEFLATSAIKRVDLGTALQIIASLNGEFAGGAVTYSAADGGISFAPPHDADIPASVTATMLETLAGLADESIDTGVDIITGLPN
jgi:basic membrane protein A